MKKKRKSLIVLIVVILALVVALAAYLVVMHDKENSLTLAENQWIDSNKKNVIDVAVLNDIPVLSYDGEGIVYNYLEFVTEKYSLDFNVIPYKLDGTTDYEYKMSIKDQASSSDIVLLKDNLVLLMNDNSGYSSVNNINNLKLGVLATDVQLLNQYFNGKNIQLVPFNTYGELKNAYIAARTAPETAQFNGIIILRSAFTKEIVENSYKIGFQFNDLNKYFVLEANGAEELNSILNKSYKIWKESNYTNEYNENLIYSYFKFKNISDVEQKNLKSKNYTYGFVNYGIYNYLDNNKISGLTGLVLKEFKRFSNLSISYTQYNSINALLKDFNSDKVDFMLNIINSSNYEKEVYNTVGVFDKELVVISGISNNTIIDSISSLKDKEILTLKDSYLEQYLIDNGIKVKSYNNVKDLTKDFSTNDIVVLDLENYNFYKTSAFKDARVSYLLNLSGKYNFVVNNKEDNKVFIDLFDFYLSFNSMDKLISTNYQDVAYENINIVYLLVIIIIILCMYLFVDFSNHIKFMIKRVKKDKKVRLTKEEKIKYIDQLTSLKNRAYLNSRIESWDDSEVYPQSIIIIDLNNVAYINDNYGREEGDKVITEAANILIQHQLQNSEIIRTDGNEFLIYLVGYSEKQIISYLRKLNKELKGLSHGFGAASGYSIITDAIKSVDDAVNEATLAMKENKEDIDY